MTSFDRAQQLRASSRLRDARDALIECSKETCPALIRRDCDQWMSEVTVSLPSVVFGAQDGAGKDLVAVRVSIDGNPIQEKLDGRAVAIDPGPHVVRYELSDGTAVEDRVLVREGEKNRALTAKFPESPGVMPSPASIPLMLPPGPSTGPARPTPPPPPAVHSKPSPANFVVGVMSGVAGLGVLGAALGFDVTATSDAHALPCAAGRSCQSSQIDPIQQKYTDADILLGVGSAAVVFGVVMLAVRPFRTAATATATASPRVDATLTRGGCTAWLKMPF
jgi:hypothetical protein